MSRIHILCISVIGLLAAMIVAACEPPAADCLPSETDCNGVCIDLSSDNGNCGECGNECNAEQVCSDGVCELDCDAGEDDCDGGCVNLDEDENNCGACGNACNPDETCDDGECQVSCDEGSIPCVFVEENGEVFVICIPGDTCVPS